MLLQQLINGALASGIYALFAVGFTMIFGIMGVLNLAHADFAMVAAFTIIWAVSASSQPVLAVVLAVLMVAAVAVVLDLGIIRPSRRFQGQSQSDIELPLIGTIGAGMILQNIAALMFGNKAVVFSFQMREYMQWGGLYISKGLLLSAAVAVVLLVLLEVMVERTSFGRQIRAVAQNVNAARIMGINTNLVTLSTIVLTAMLAGIAGVLAGLSYGLVSPYMGGTYAIKGLVAMILGGVGSLRGAVLGSLVIGLTEALAVTYFGSQLRDSTVFLVLLAMLLLRPSGLFKSPGVG
ncbi:MAG: branched-chain amino acid ABC transporter permease [Candidatus Lambdaproteobacteria bacterium]|nr:branched-chain amino acid ABC transporter permease [Candidatus Lambdaproteobacteria bacterium]